MSLWLARILIGLVFLFNIQCAILFLWIPEVYTPSFELSGASGAAMVRGLGVLFLMWNVPYAVAMMNPLRNHLSLYEATAMQAIGVVGEAIILWILPPVHLVARLTLARFIAFDSAGLAALLMAGWIARR